MMKNVKEMLMWLKMESPAFLAAHGRPMHFQVIFKSFIDFRQRLVKGHGEDSIKMLDDTETNYFYSQAEGTSTLLALTDEESRSTSWQFMLCGFEIDGKIIPPDLVQECPRKNSEEIKSDEQVVETQQQEQQQGSNE